MNNQDSSSTEKQGKIINAHGIKTDLINSQQKNQNPHDIFVQNRQEIARRKIANAACAALDIAKNPDDRFVPILGASGRYPDVRLAEWVAAREAIRDTDEVAPDAATLEAVIDARTLQRYAQRRHSHHRMSQAMAAAADCLEASGDRTYLHGADDLRRLARQLETCRADGAAGVAGFSDGSIASVKMWDAKCNSSLFCAFEAAKSGLRLHEKYSPEILHHVALGESAYFAVLTLPNTPIGDHSALRAAIDDGFGRVRTWVDGMAITGAVIVCECPLSRDGESWNLHYNVFFLSPAYLDYADAREAWGYNAEFVGVDRMLEIAQRREDRQSAVEGRPAERIGVEDAVASAFRELSKYAAKVVGTSNANGDDSDNPISAWPWRRLCEWMSAWKGFRRARTTGVLNCVARRRWQRAQYARRVEWCKFAGVAIDHAACRWLHVDEGSRELLALAQCGRRKRKIVDFDSQARIVDAGGVVRVYQGGVVVTLIDLIQGNNFGNRRATSRWKKYAGSGQRSHPGSDPPVIDQSELPF